MSEILQKLRDVDPNDSDAVKEAVTAFFQNLLKHTRVNCYNWLQVLEDVITRFPRYCAQHRTTIEKYLVNFLDSTNYLYVIVTAKCAHGLQQIRPSQDKAATPKNCWREQMTLLCNAVHSLIEVIYTNTVAIYRNNKTVKKPGAVLLANTPLTLALSRILNANKSQTTSEEKKSALVNKLKNIFVLIQAMLVEAYPVGKPIQPQIILEVIVLALSFSSSSNTDSAEASIVKIQALRTLDALIACLGKNLIPFSALVVRFVMQTLRWTSENINEESRNVRCAAYKSLSSWLSILHVHRVTTEGKDRSWEDELARHVLDDITVPKKIVMLTMNKQPTKNLSKKAKRKLANQQLDQSALIKYMPGEKDKDDMPTEQREDVAMAALECAETFLTVCGIFLKQTTHKLFHERLVRECYNVDSYSESRSIRLLRTLDAARKNTAANVPPPTQYCVQLYSTLINSQSNEIRKFCSQALLDIRLHLHCSPPTINFALEVQQDQLKPKNKLQAISKQNRAVLAKLLEKNKIPDLEIDESVNEAIAAEEPTNKKPRFEEADDTRISISSDSECSVVISDDSEVEVEVLVQVINDGDTVSEQENMNENGEEIEQANRQSQSDSVSNNDIAESTENSNDDVQMITPSAPKLEDICLPPTSKSSNIHDATTQVVLNTSTDAVVGEKSPESREIAYDLPQTPKKVTFLEKMDDENLPSTSETDDIQITCGQQVKSSSETNEDVEINGKEDEVVEEEGIALGETNGTAEVNGECSKENTDTEVKKKSTEVTVDDMMADFVDEVVEDPNLVS